MKSKAIAYWVSTGLMCLLFAGSGTMYLANHAEVSEVFAALGFPAWIVYPLAIAKIAGVVAILSRASRFLKELAYAGFLYDALLAFGAHTAAGDGEAGFSVAALVLIAASWSLDRAVFGPVRQGAALPSAR